MNNLESLSQQARKLMIESLVVRESHHIGCALSIVDILTYLYFEQIKVFPNNPKNPDRDIFILSKGHAALALYATLHQKGFFNKDFLLTYDKNGGNLPEHASSIVPGVELSTGSLGHGLSVGLGFATAFKKDMKNNKAYILMSDGEFDEGSNWEAIMYAGQHHLDNVIVIVDLNGFQGYAPTNKVIDLSPLDKKIAMFNWDTYQINGHHFTEMKTVFTQINQSKSLKPKMIFAKTIKGKGISYFEGKFESHYQFIDQETKEEVLKGLRGQ